MAEPPRNGARHKPFSVVATSLLNGTWRQHSQHGSDLLKKLHASIQQKDDHEQAKHESGDHAEDVADHDQAPRPSLRPCAALSHRHFSWPTAPNFS